MEELIVAIAYSEIWDDFDSVNPASLLRGIPTTAILNYIVERQNEVLFAFSDTERI